MGYRAALLNFSKGEISPALESRFDLSAYQAGMRTALNVKIKRTGGVTKRVGTRFVAEALGPLARLIPFQFSNNQAYALEFGQGVMRPFALGGAVLEEGLLVTGITNEAQAVITAAYHGYSLNDPVYLSGIAGRDEINDRFLRVVEVIDANHFRVNFNSTGAGAFTGSGGGTARTVAPSAPPPPPTVPPPYVPPPEPETGTGGTGGYTPGGWTGSGGGGGGSGGGPIRNL